MADEAEPLEALENADEFSRIGVNVVGEDVLVDRAARGGVGWAASAPSPRSSTTTL